MDLKCLIKLLLEKEIITESRGCTINGESVSKTFKFKYEEVYKKILQSEYNKDIIKISKAEYDKNKICILNVDNLEKGLIYVGDGHEKFGFSKDTHHLDFPYYKLEKIINNDTRFYTKAEDLNYDYYYITDALIESQRIEKEIKDKMEVLNFLDQLPTDIPDELIFSDIKKKYDYDYTYTADDGHAVDSHEKIVPSFKHMIEIFSDLYDHDLEYNSIFGPNREYLEKSLKEIKRMEAIKKEIEETYGDKVKCILSDWNEGCQFGCTLYIYIL